MQLKLKKIIKVVNCKGYLQNVFVYNKNLQTVISATLPKGMFYTY